jgi:tetratricopeptide (TPR) repeat protein
MGSVYFNQGQHEKGIAEVERAIALNPNGANNYVGLAAMVGGLGRWDESIELAKKAYVSVQALRLIIITI